MRKIKWKTLLINLAIPLAVGGLAALLTGGGMRQYSMLKRPPLSPPGVVFPIVWTILFILMGISAYRIYCSEASEKTKRTALLLYGTQLAVNFAWTLLFFGAGAYGFAFVWLLLLWALIVAMAFKFYDIDPVAAYLQIPYLLWTTFAAYLSFGILLLNG